MALTFKPPYHFQAALEIIGVNPFVSVPTPILQAIFEAAGREKGPIPISGTINGAPYTQTLVKFAGQWRLYVNMVMLKDSPQRIGENIAVSIAFDPKDRSIQPHPKWVAALAENEDAKTVFDRLPPSRQKEIVRYIANLKNDEAIERNVLRALEFLRGNGRFVGRDKP